MSKKDKQVNIRLTEAQFNEIDEKAKKSSFSTTSEFLRFAATNCYPELCRSFLFLIDVDGETNVNLTSLVQEVRIDESSVTITFILDEKNLWKKMIESKKEFKVWWLTRTGEKIDYYHVQHYLFPSVKIFPLRFGHSIPELAIGMAILRDDI